jgi:hypothetical protein
VLPGVGPNEKYRVIIRNTTFRVMDYPDRQWWGVALQRLHKAHIKGFNIQLGNPRRSVTNRRSRVLFLAERDGWDCWYCGCQLQPLGDDAAQIEGARPATLEELCSRHIGGPAHVDNQVLACQRCNALAANLPVSEKVKLREKKRSSPVPPPESGDTGER